MAQVVLFDVGSHNGYEFFEIASRNPSYAIYAFEPTPWAADYIRKLTAHLPNFHVVQAAVTLNDGTATLNISRGDANHNDSGCNSLHEFIPTTEHDCFTTIETVEVPTIRLDTFIREHKIECINFLHVDAQGEDLSVLRSLGAFKDIVLEGVVELATNKSKTIYTNNPDIAEGLEWLHSNGFLAVRIDPNDPPGVAYTTEHNVRFVRAGKTNSVTLVKNAFTDAYHEIP